MQNKEAIDHEMRMSAMRNVYDSIGGHRLRLRLPGMSVPMHAGLFAFESDRALEDYVYNAEDLRNLTFVDHTAEHEAQEEAGDGRREPLRPEDFID